jgi:hypothetical protein
MTAAARMSGAVPAEFRRRARTVAAVLAASRLCSPAPPDDTAGWASNAHRRPPVPARGWLPAAPRPDRRPLPRPGPGENGWPAVRPIARQVKTLQVKTLQVTVATGVALYFRPHKGSY